MHAHSLQSCPTLCNTMDCNPPGFSVHGIFQARILEYIVVPSYRGSSRLKDQTRVSCTAGGFFTTEPPESPKGEYKSTQTRFFFFFVSVELCHCLAAKSCPTLLQSHGLYSLPGSSVHGISQARILEWFAIPFSRGSSQPGIEPTFPAL